QLVRERRDVAHVDLGADDRPARGDRLQGTEDQLTGGGEQDGGIERLRRRLGGRPGPCRTELASERLRRRVAGTGEREHPTTFGDRDLRRDVGPAVLLGRLRAGGGAPPAKSRRAPAGWRPPSSAWRGTRSSPRTGAARPAR